MFDPVLTFDVGHSVGCEPTKRENTEKNYLAHSTTKEIKRDLADAFPKTPQPISNQFWLTCSSQNIQQYLWYEMASYILTSLVKNWGLVGLWIILNSKPPHTVRPFSFASTLFLQSFSLVLSQYAHWPETYLWKDDTTPDPTGFRPVCLYVCDDCSVRGKQDLEGKGGGSRWVDCWWDFWGTDIKSK